MAGDSVTFNVTDSNGFDVMYTIREKDKEKSFSERVKSTSEMLKIEGYSPKAYKPKPSGAVSATPPAHKEKDWTGKTCPKCAGRLYSITTRTGKLMIKCENSKWDPKTKTASGCDYVEWPKTY